MQNNGEVHLLLLQQKSRNRTNGQKGKVPILRKQTSIQKQISNHKSKSSMTPETQEKIKQLQTYEQQLQQLAAQKQQIESSIFEYENAITESEKAPTAYKIVGTIMVEKNKEDLKKDLSEKKELAEVRLGSIEKQEKQIREKAQALQEELLKEMK